MMTGSADADGRHLNDRSRADMEPPPMAGLPDPERAYAPPFSPVLDPVLTAAKIFEGE
jgi:hypothetical protein